MPKVEKLDEVKALCHEHTSKVQEKEAGIQIPVHEGDAVSLIFYEK